MSEKKYIDLSDALQAVCLYCSAKEDCDYPCADYDAMKDIPTVDAVEQAHGKWVWMSSTYDRSPREVRYECSCCHHETITHDDRPWERYCPWCGAKMED